MDGLISGEMVVGKDRSMQRVWSWLKLPMIRSVPQLERAVANR